ncbi:metalloregulator ArsR/SmtB family transcription factor [Priestia koreensis]|uniref:DUF2087 domain-containing protein n=1 Tax=Priestia koreensis TaxID=284581 RepID=UPI003016741D
MQLNRLVAFHKTMGDTTRVRILMLLANGPLHGQAIAGKLGLTAPTITHHMNKLKEIGAIYQRREGNTIYFYLDQKSLEFSSNALLKMIMKGEEGKLTKSKQGEYELIVQNFLQGDGRLKTIPAQRKKKQIILRYMMRSFEKGRKYEEKEINEHIKRFHDDYATIRREFIMSNMMYRENGIYEVNPEELWMSVE